jgi:hypothetical protein
MKRYQCKGNVDNGKIVQAGRIIAIESGPKSAHDPLGQRVVTITVEGGAQFNVGWQAEQLHGAQVGGYLVIDADGKQTYRSGMAGFTELPEALPQAATTGNAPKVEETRINALVASLTYETAHVLNTTSTVATARLPGGFVAAIGHSACVAPENFDAEKGRQYAIEDAERQARDKLWAFEGYALYLELEKLRAAGIGHMPAHQQRVVLEQIENRNRLDKLNAFRAAPYFGQLDGAEQGRLTRQADIMQQLDTVLSERINAFPLVSE